MANIEWRRVILDEAHRIKNHSTKACKAICALKAKYRLALTGTPIHNSMTDLYSLVKFLHFDPLDDLGLWKYLFETEKLAKQGSEAVNANAQERKDRFDTWLELLSRYLILRRTKANKYKGTEKRVVDLPDKHIEFIKLKLGAREKAIYDKWVKYSFLISTFWKIDAC